VRTEKTRDQRARVQVEGLDQQRAPVVRVGRPGGAHPAGPLAVPAERYLWTSTGTYGYAWLYKPSVLAIGVLILAILAFGFRLRRRIDTTVQANKEHEDLRDGEL
jgi:hypothetical protein